MARQHQKEAPPFITGARQARHGHYFSHFLLLRISIKGGHTFNSCLRGARRRSARGRRRHIITMSVSEWRFRGHFKVLHRAETATRPTSRTVGGRRGERLRREISCIASSISLVSKAVGGLAQPRVEAAETPPALAAQLAGTRTGLETNQIPSHDSYSFKAPLPLLSGLSAFGVNTHQRNTHARTHTDLTHTRRTLKYVCAKIINDPKKPKKNRLPKVRCMKR